MLQTQDDLAEVTPEDAGPEGSTVLAARMLFTGPVETVSQELYAMVECGVAARRRAGVTLEPGTKVSGNTYFGRFPATYWQRWTAVREVRVELTVNGTGRVSVAASDVNGFARVVAARTVTDCLHEPIALVAPLDRFADGGALWLELETTDNRAFSVDNVQWTVTPPEVARTTSLAFCTVNRPNFCVGILGALAADQVVLDRLDRVYVVDHGGGALASHDGYRRAADRLGDRLRYVVQPNLGSAGGLNRGLYEMVGEGRDGPASLLTFDDDVMLEPDVVVRLTAFGDHVTQPAIVGAQMLNLFHTNVLLADAQETDIDGIQPGEPVPHARADVDLLARDPVTGRRHLQERRLDAGYTAWWACLVPLEVLDEIGYVLPVFTQADDAEYCYRARAHGIPTLTLPGVAVWHTDFTMKDLDGVKTYFIRRNYLVLAALHGELPVGRLVRRFVAELSRYLLGMRYGLAAALLAAIDHFLDGPDDLRDGGTARLAELRELRSRFPDTVLHHATAVSGVRPNELALAVPGPPPRRPVLFALSRVVDQLRGRFRYPLGEVAHDEAHWWHVCRFRSVVVTDASQEGVRLRRYDRGVMLRLAARGARTLWRLRRTGGTARRRYRAALPDLTSRETWTRLYGQGPTQ